MNGRYVQQRFGDRNIGRVPAEVLAYIFLTSPLPIFEEHS
jgi:hypothetical protein